MAEVIHKVRIGRVVSDKMDKTRVVAIEWKQPHPKYKRLVTRVTKLKMHDEKGETKVGDMVRMVEGRPLSKEKRWRLAEIVKKGVVAEVAPVEIDESTLAELAAKQRPVKKENEEKSEE